jgi:hypothetical protein
MDEKDALEYGVRWLVVEFGTSKWSCTVNSGLRVLGGLIVCQQDGPSMVGSPVRA